MLMTFLLVAAVVCVVAGLGWSVPIIALTYIKNFFSKQTRETAEMRFLTEWVFLQGIFGLITIVGFPISFIFVDSMIVFHFMTLYAIASVVSGLLLWSILFRK